MQTLDPLNKIFEWSKLLFYYFEHSHKINVLHKGCEAQGTCVRKRN